MSRSVVASRAGQGVKQFVIPALLVAAALGPTSGCTRAPATPALLTSAAQIRRLSPGDAELAIPVRLRGVATYQHARSRTLIVQAGSDGVFVDSGTVVIPTVTGREIEVEGFTAAGDSTAIVVATAFRSSNEPERVPARTAGEHARDHRTRAAYGRRDPPALAS